MVGMGLKVLSLREVIKVIMAMADLPLQGWMQQLHSDTLLGVQGCGCRNNYLGLVKGPMGTPATSPEESISLLLDEYIPGSQTIVMVKMPILLLKSRNNSIESMLNPFWVVRVQKVKSNASLMACATNPGWALVTAYWSKISKLYINQSITKISKPYKL
jgi:hypothetical protein